MTATARLRTCRTCGLHAEVSDRLAEALWRAVVDAPDDDGPRLAYADYLLSHDDPRGELVHVEHALERAPTDPALAARRRELRRMRAYWLGALPTAVTNVEVDRGAISALEIDDLLTRHHAEQLINAPALQLCRQLRIEHAWLSDETFTRIVEGLCRPRGPVCALALAHLGLGDAVLEILARAGAELVELDVCDGIGNDGLRALGRGASWTLEVLALAFNTFEASAIAALTGGMCPRLRELRIAHHALADLGPLAEARPLPSLEVLRLNSCGIRAGLAGLAPLLRGMRELDLRGNVITDDALAELLALPAVAGLQTLQLDDNRLTDAAVDLLCASRVGRVRFLGNSFTPDGERRLLERFWPGAGHPLF